MTDRPTAAAALARAEAAHTKIDSHEGLCAFRYAQIEAAIKGIQGEQTYSRRLQLATLLSVAGGLALILAGVVLYALKLQGN